MSEKIIPTIGRVVWYRDSYQSDQFLAATVCYVWSEDLVNLSVSDQHGCVSGRNSIPFHHGEAAECPDNHCCWPYQKKQAEKHAAENADNAVAPA